MSNPEQSATTSLSRRALLTSATVAGAATVAAPLLATREARAQVRGEERPRGRLRGREKEAFALRYDAAVAHLETGANRAPERNGDEGRYADLRASFCKTLPQNEYGEVDVAAFEQLRAALGSGDFATLEEVPLSPAAERALANPLASHAFEMIGPDSWALRMPAPPAFASALQASEMLEVYWQALTRDVPFRQWGSDPEIAAAIEDLNALDPVVGTGDPITLSSLFRGESEREWVGPYLSQLLWLPAQWGVASLDQRFALPFAGQDFGTGFEEWLALQRGAEPSTGTALDTSRRYIATGRDLAEYVHNDVSYQAYLTAALVLFAFGDEALDPGIPFPESVTQTGFVTLGVTEIADLVAKAAHAALKAAWFQKWLVHRRLRPEVFAARASLQASGARDYDVHTGLLDSTAADQLLSRQGSLLLPLAFPEGSPTHPSYPAGHAAMAGACATVLKAFFREDFELPEPVEASADGQRLDAWTGAPLTVGGEIDKLASNVSLGRDIAGVHYRSDGIDGMALGEVVALGILQDYARSRAERFAGFTLTRFDGSTVLVGGDGVSPPLRRRRRRRPRRRESA